MSIYHNLIKNCFKIALVTLFFLIVQNASSQISVVFTEPNTDLTFAYGAEADVGDIAISEAIADDFNCDVSTEIISLRAPSGFTFVGGDLLDLSASDCDVSAQRIFLSNGDSIEDMANSLYSGGCMQGDISQLLPIVGVLL